MRLSEVLPLAICFTGAFSVGCSAPLSAPGSNGSVGSDGTDAEAAMSSLALVSVERTSSPGDSARAEAVARFVRVRGGAVDDDALRMVGAAVDFPVMGSCAGLGALSASVSSATAFGGRATTLPRALELMDVGAVTLEANAQATSLVARRLPDMADLVSGVVYARTAGAEAMPARGRYDLHVAGNVGGGGGNGNEVAPFSIGAYAPGEPAELRIAGRDAREPGAVPLTRAGSAEVLWEPGAVEDLIYVDVGASAASAPSPLSPPSSGRVRCLFPDSGRAVLGSDVFGAVEDGTITVHRIHKEPFRARGVDGGEVRFDFARTVAFTRR